MSAITIILIGIIIILSVCIIMYTSEINHLNKQLEFIIENDTNKIVQVSYSKKNIVKLANNIEKLTKKQRKATLQERKSKNQIKDDITSLSHDIRTPLTSLNGYFELLNTTEDIEEKKKYQAIIMNRIDSLSRILEQLFVYTKIENDAYNFEMSQCNVSNVLSKTLLAYYDTLKENNIVPVIDMDEDVYCIANDELLERVFQNLIRNAILYGNGSLKVSLHKNSDCIDLEFENECDSTDEIDEKRLFDKFYRADKARTKGANGLGLYIVKELLAKVGGSVTSEIKDGLFTIHIHLNTNIKIK